MIRHAAFLRGVNLGRRTVRSADLVVAFEAMGFSAVKTLLASGNVLFDAAPAKTLQRNIEAALEERFGFDIGTVLRTIPELREMVGADPFAGMRENEERKLYVLLFAEPLPATVTLTGVAGDYDVAGRTARDVFVVAHRKPNGRYGEGMDKLEKQLPKGVLVTSRNFNTVLKAAA